MRAVVFSEFGEPPMLGTVPDPEPPPEGAVIRVEATGLCRSDWHAWSGHDPGVRLPHVPGHELAGTIEAVGSRVERWRPGTRVTTPFVCACGRCPSCAAGAQQVCERQTQPGFTHWGSFAEYVTIHHADVNLVEVPDALTASTAAILGCRYATAFRALLTVGRARPGEWCAVHGCGGVGLSAISIAVAAGARVIAVDIATEALDLARAAGATIAIDASRLGSRSRAADPAGDPVDMSVDRATDAKRVAEVAEAIADATGGGADLSIDAFGSPDTCAASIACLRRRGRHVQVGLLPAAGTPVPMDLVVARELEVLGSHGMPAHAYPPMLALIAERRLRPDLLITRTIGLSAAPEALATMDRTRRPGITIVDPRLA